MIKINGQNINHLVTFGCSNTFGIELDNPSTEAWPAILAKMINVSYTNISECAISNNRILYLALNYLNKIRYDGNNILVIIQLTSLLRMFYHINKSFTFHYLGTFCGTNKILIDTNIVIDNNISTPNKATTNITNISNIDNDIYNNNNLLKKYLQYLMKDYSTYCLNLFIKLYNFINLLNFYKINYKVICSDEFPIENKNCFHKYLRKKITENKNCFLKTEDKKFYNYLYYEIKVPFHPYGHPYKEGHEIWAQYIYNHYLFKNE